MQNQNTVGLITDNFLLTNSFAEELYHDYAKDQPIIDYHNHLSAKDILENKNFKNITEAWLNGDHYKWRAMRTFGINEKNITGNATDQEKFKAWSSTVPFTIRNPLFHWTHLELERYFGISEYLNEASAEAIYKDTTAQLQKPEFSTQGLLKKMNVNYVCTTEDPIDSLEHHKNLSGSAIQVSTAFRPDKALEIGQPTYLDYIKKLSKVSAIEIETYQKLQDALIKRINDFHEVGCRIADHGLSNLEFIPTTDTEATTIFAKKLNGKELSDKEIAQFKTALLLFVAKQYHKRSWVQQFHLGALRNNNRRLLKTLGPDTGFDSIGDYKQAENLSAFLNELDSSNQLSKTILYNLNPSQNEVFATMTGNFNDGSVKGKVQFGSGWWFLDQKDGMTKQLNTLSNMGLLSCFVGMLTDSRSFLSFPRHEYFRRILCNILGEEMKNGELPQDLPWIGGIVKDICYTNAKNYFNL